MLMKANITVIVDVKDDAEASDCLSENLTPVIQKFDKNGFLIDWFYTDWKSNKTFKYWKPAKKSDITE